MYGRTPYEESDIEATKEYFQKVFFQKERESSSLSTATTAAVGGGGGQDSGFEEDGWVTTTKRKPLKIDPLSDETASFKSIVSSSSSVSSSNFTSNTTSPSSSEYSSPSRQTGSRSNASNNTEIINNLVALLEAQYPEGVCGASFRKFYKEYYEVDLVLPVGVKLSAFLNDTPRVTWVQKGNKNI